MARILFNKTLIFIIHNLFKPKGYLQVGFIIYLRITTTTGRGTYPYKTQGILSEQVDVF